MWSFHEKNIAKAVYEQISIVLVHPKHFKHMTCFIHPLIVARTCFRELVIFEGKANPYLERPFA